MLARSSRALPAVARGASRVRALSSAIDLKGIGQPADAQNLVVDGVTVMKVVPVEEAVGAGKSLPPMPPKLEVNWDYLTTGLDEAAKKEVLGMKTVFDRYQREIDQERAELAGAGSIDWSAWEEKLASANASKMIAEFKSELDSFTFDPKEQNAVIDQFRNDIKEMVRAAPRAAACAEAGWSFGRLHLPRTPHAPRRPCPSAAAAQELLVATEKEKLNMEIEQLEAAEASITEQMANVKNVTIAELMEQDPEMAMEVEDEIRNDNWAA